MKKTLLIVAALFATFTAFAQANLALNKQAYASSNSDENNTFTPEKAVDGDAGTKWASNYDTKGLLGWGDDEKNAQWFYVDLGEETTVNTVKITWDNAPAAEFDIRYSTADPATEPKSAGDVALSGLAGTANGTNTYKFDSDVTARYIILDLKRRATGWHYGIFELVVNNIDYNASELTSISASPKFFPVNTATEFTLTAIDNFNNPMTDVAYTIAGAVFAGTYTAAEAGVITITGTKNNVSATTDVYAVAETTFDVPEDAVVIYGVGTTNEWYCDWNGGAKQDNTFTISGMPVKSFTALNCAFIGNPALNAWDADVNPTAMQYGKLHFSIYSPVAQAARVEFERTVTIGNVHAVSLNEGWNDVEIDLEGETKIHTISLRGEAIDLAVANIYYTKADAIEDADQIASVTVDPKIVAAGVATELTLKGLNRIGSEIAEGVTFTADGLEGNTLTAAAAGTVTITGSTNNGNETATADVYAISAPERATADDNTLIIFDGQNIINTQDGSGTDWDGGYTQLDKLTYSDGSRAFHAKNVRKFYLSQPGVSAADITKYTKFHLDLFSSVDRDGVVVNIEGINKSTTLNVKAGEWTSVDVNIEGSAAATSWIWVKFAEPAGDNDAEIVVDNIYFSKEAVAIPFSITVDDNGVATVLGDVKAENIAEINAADAMFIDLTGINSIEENLTIEPLNPNALIGVSGTVEANLATADAKFETLNAKNQVVVATWVFPVAQLEFIDANGNKWWNGEGTTQNFISAGARGYKITRTIDAGQYTSTATTATVTAPEGLDVYEAASYDEANGLKFNKKANAQVMQNFPYILYNGTSEAIDFVVEGTGDLNLNTATGSQNVEVGATFTCNYTTITTDGSQYIIRDNDFKKANGAKIGAFRSFFTFAGANAAESILATFDDGETTSVKLMNQTENGDLRFFDLQGRSFNQRPTQQGVYIHNGKKIFIK